MPSSYALGQTFMPKKASQKFDAECKVALPPTFSLYEIDPRMKNINDSIQINSVNFSDQHNAVRATSFTFKSRTNMGQLNQTGTKNYIFFKWSPITLAEFSKLRQLGLMN